MVRMSCASGAPVRMPESMRELTKARKLFGPFEGMNRSRIAFHRYQS